MAKSQYEEFVENFGEEFAKELIGKFGGMRLKVPARYKQNHALAALGQEKVERFSAIYAGNDIEIPRNVLAKKKRTKCIIDLHAAGTDLNTIARTVGCSQNWVRKVLRAQRTRAQESKR